jgi:hypothetical protein
MDEKNEKGHVFVVIIRQYLFLPVFVLQVLIVLPSQM